MVAFTHENHSTTAAKVGLQANSGLSARAQVCTNKDEETAIPKMNSFNYRTFILLSFFLWDYACIPSLPRRLSAMVMSGLAHCFGLADNCKPMKLLMADQTTKPIV